MQSQYTGVPNLPPFVLNRAPIPLRDLFASLRAGNEHVFPQDDQHTWWYYPLQDDGFRFCGVVARITYVWSFRDGSDHWHGDWAAYAGSAPTAMSIEGKVTSIADYGTKLTEAQALTFFPALFTWPYRS